MIGLKEWNKQPCTWQHTVYLAFVMRCKGRGCVWIVVACHALSQSAASTGMLSSWFHEKQWHHESSAEQLRFQAQRCICQNASRATGWPGTCSQYPSDGASSNYGTAVYVNNLGHEWSRNYVFAFRLSLISSKTSRVQIKNGALIGTLEEVQPWARAYGKKRCS